MLDRIYKNVFSENKYIVFFSFLMSLCVFVGSFYHYKRSDISLLNSLLISPAVPGLYKYHDSKNSNEVYTNFHTIAHYDYFISLAINAFETVELAEMKESIESYYIREKRELTEGDKEDINIVISVFQSAKPQLINLLQQLNGEDVYDVVNKNKEYKAKVCGKEYALFIGEYMSEIAFKELFSLFLFKKIDLDLCILTLQTTLIKQNLNVSEREYITNNIKTNIASIIYATLLNIKMSYYEITE